MTKSDVPPGAGAIVVEPSTTFLTACATLNWIAFRKAEDGDLTGEGWFRREFGYPPKVPPEFNPLDYAVAEAANALTPHQQERMADRMAQYGREWNELGPARERMAHLLAERSWSAVELYIRMQARRDMWLKQTGDFWTAQDQLKEALQARKLMIWATPAAAADPWLGHSLPLPGASARAVAWEFFLTSDAAVAANGSVWANGRPSFVDAKLLASEVLALWPTPQAGTSVPTGDAPPAFPSNAATNWMRAHVTTPGAWKRKSAIQQCSIETGATSRESTAAWDILPETLRGKRGAHK